MIGKMKKRIIAILFCIIFLVPSCASSKPVMPKSESTVEKVVKTVNQIAFVYTIGTNLSSAAVNLIPKSEPTVEKVVSKDPLMKLLASALIIYAIQILVTR